MDLPVLNLAAAMQMHLRLLAMLWQFNELSQAPTLLQIPDAAALPAEPI